MRNYRQEFSLARMAVVLGVTRGSYYKWSSRGASIRDRENRYLLSKIEEIFQFHKKRYGSSRIHHELLKQGTECSRQKVAGLMRAGSLYCIRAKRYKVTTNSKHNKIVSPNLLNQNFRTILRIEYGFQI